MMNLVSLETLDPVKEISDQQEMIKELELRGFWKGFAYLESALVVYIMNINCFVSIFYTQLYGAFVLIHMKLNDNNLFEEYKWCYSQTWFLFLLLNYLDEKTSRDQFFLHSKVSKLLTEQRQIFNVMPDGIIIHQNQNNEDKNGASTKASKYKSLVKYFNHTFLTMLMANYTDHDSKSKFNSGSSTSFNNLHDEI